VPKPTSTRYGRAIAVDNIAAADGLLRRIMHKVELAADNPLMGAARPELSPTARLLIEGRYVVIYEPRPDGVLVIAVVHGMRDPASWLG
jgi:toxin ParE1/3/4